jgi:hypothetical protein
MTSTDKASRHRSSKKPQSTQRALSKHRKRDFALQGKTTHQNSRTAKAGRGLCVQIKKYETQLLRGMDNSAAD